MQIPSTQRAIVVEKTGGPEVLEYRTDYPVPKPKSGHILVRNTISSINFIDTYFRTGLYPSPKPEVLGREAVGTVAALGPETDKYDLKIGDRVIWLATGGYAEFSSVPAEKTIKIPAGLRDEDVLASFMSGLTALALTQETYTVKPGDWVLLHAAAGGVGILMAQILKGLGATVIGTAGGPDKVELVKALGVDHVIDYRSDQGTHWTQDVLELTKGVGVDVVYDSVGKDTWKGSLEVVKRKGTVVWFGNSSGPIPPLPLQQLSPKCVKIARPTLFGYITTREEFEYYSGQIFDLLQAGELKVNIHGIYDLEEAQKAHKTKR
ncbi:putative quinone oxidoreductase [Fusarium oxysporum f. sp. raphani]|uniref:Probable quinone oxidoreductase n=1 Tax=Fusarium oxysporum f. sp. raphani TaxID=96318 RepID=A0A8J5QBZ7_FUSOX|nr:putative quinone oxidoreductase [Fusarium oxysporum f. sp. raphani]